MTNLHINDFDAFRTLYSEGAYNFGHNERAYIEVTLEQLEGQSPDFIGDGILKDDISSFTKQNRHFIMINATKKVNGVLVGDPDWVDGVVDQEIINFYLLHYGDTTLRFQKELDQLNEESL